MKRIASSIFLLVMFLPTSAMAFQMRLLGVGDICTPAVTGSAKPTIIGKMGTGFGLTASVELTSYLDVEAGVISVERVVGLTGNGTKEKLISKTMQVPVLAKLWLGNYVNLGAGLYLSQSSGTLSVNGKPVSYKSYGLNPNEFGWLAGAGVDIPWSIIGFTFDVRLQNSLVDVSRAPAAKWYNSDMQFLAGIRFLDL